MHSWSVLDISGSFYAMAMSSLGEIFRPGTITRVPAMHTAVLGYANRRGDPIAIIDPVKLLGIPGKPCEPGPHLMAVSMVGTDIAIVIDRAVDVTRAEPQRVTDHHQAIVWNGSSIAIIDASSLRDALQQLRLEARLFPLPITRTQVTP